MICYCCKIDINHYPKLRHPPVRALYIKMNNSTVFDITKISIETYDSKTKQKAWNHLSNLNPIVQYEMKVVVEQTNIVFQIYNKANKQDMHLNLKVKCQIHPETKKPYVSSATLRMIIKPPIIAFRYNIKDMLTNEIILKKAQFAIPNDLSFHTMIDTLVEKGVTLKDSKNRDYNHEISTNSNFETNYEKFESQIIESQQQDRTFNISSPIENSKSKHLSPVKESLFEPIEEPIGYGHKQSNFSQPASSVLESNVQNSYKNINNIKPPQNSQNLSYFDQAILKAYKERQYNSTDRFNFKDHVNEEVFLPQQSYNSFKKNINTKDLNYYHSEPLDQRNQQELNMNVNTAKNSFDSFNGPNFSFGPQHSESLTRRCSFYEIPLEQLYNTQRRNSVLVPMLPQNDVSSNGDNKGKVMKKEDIENMMTSVLNNVLPTISDLQKATAKNLPSEGNSASDVVKAPEINTKIVVKNVDGLSLDFFLCLDNETKIAILKNLGFFPALKLISGCDKNAQSLIHDLIEKELGEPIKTDSIFKANDRSCLASQDLKTDKQCDAKERNDPSSANPKKSDKSSKTLLAKPPSTPKKVSKVRRSALSPTAVLKELETWEKIDEETVEGAVVGKRFLRKPRKSRISSLFEQKDTESLVGVSYNETLVNQENLSYDMKVSKKISPKLCTNLESSALVGSNDVNQRNITFDKNTEIITGSSNINDIGNSSSLVENEVFNNHTKYKKSHELLK